MRRQNTFFLDAIRNFRVADCDCFVESDREILYGKIKEYYGSDANFERFLKFTVIALTGRSLAARATRSELGSARWVTLAEDCGFDDLATALGSAQPNKWLDSALHGQASSLDSDLQSAIQAKCEEWFLDAVSPLIIQQRNMVVPNKIRSLMQRRKVVLKSGAFEPNQRHARRHALPETTTL